MFSLFKLTIWKKSPKNDNYIIFIYEYVESGQNICYKLVRSKINKKKLIESVFIVSANKWHILFLIFAVALLMSHLTSREADLNTVIGGYIKYAPSRWAQ